MSVKNFSDNVALPFGNRSIAMEPVKVDGNTINMSLGQNFTVTPIDRGGLIFTHLRNGQTGNIHVKKANKVLGFSKNVRNGVDITPSGKECIIGYTTFDNMLYFTLVFDE